MHPQPTPACQQPCCSTHHRRQRRPCQPTRHQPRLGSTCRAGVAASVLAWVVAFAAALPAPDVWAQQFNIQPGTSVLVGEPLQIEMIGWPKDALVTVRAQRVVAVEGRKTLHASQAVFRADAQGRINLATQAPFVGGSTDASNTYSGADVRGLLWSMSPAPGAMAPAAVAAADPRRVTFTASMQGTDMAATVPPPTVTQSLDLLTALPSVQSRAAASFEGAVLAWLPLPDRAGERAAERSAERSPERSPDRPVKRPALILLGGSEGGTAVAKNAPLWASHGYAVLALPYYSAASWGPNGPGPAELPTLPAAFADIAIDRLEQARDWLAQQPEVDATRIGVMGTSKGAEFALLAASKMAWIKSIVAMVPSDVVWEGWGPGVEPGQRASFSWRGQTLNFVTYQGFPKEMAGFATGQDVKIRRPHDQGRAAHPERAIAARIRVEDITAPVMLVGGGDDQLWDSGGMAQNIAKVRQAAGRDTLALIYRDAGHYVGGTGTEPTTQYNASPLKVGGTPAANAQAQADAFAKTVEFLRRTLGPVTP
jgi:dienelactone hydrolase